MARGSSVRSLTSTTDRIKAHSLSLFWGVIITSSQAVSVLKDQPGVLRWAAASAPARQDRLQCVWAACRWRYRPLSVERQWVWVRSCWEQGWVRCWLDGCTNSQQLSALPPPLRLKLPVRLLGDKIEPQWMLSQRSHFQKQSFLHPKLYTLILFNTKWYQSQICEVKVIWVIFQLNVCIQNLRGQKGWELVCTGGWYPLFCFNILYHQILATALLLGGCSQTQCWEIVFSRI